jgi:hypothetical protein
MGLLGTVPTWVGSGNNDDTPSRHSDKEMASTRRLLEWVPDQEGQWKPHEKSFPLGHLAQLRPSGHPLECLDPQGQNPGTFNRPSAVV